ncbi:MFS transporter [Brevibacillus reuszeri]|uniref:Arabinose transporter permease n=2 Tax=Brevibacillus reuszeri TaxID=54915 RepID=A0A0K9YJY7_9BACL|nr:arabinose transporter permease [Brevibacillus reuszeri]GED71492.1 MFS transporter [Brevibacillus reuszeri]
MSLAKTPPAMKPGISTNQSIWRNRPFLVLFFTSTFLACGAKVYELALPLLLYDMTQSPVTMTTMKSIEFLPNLLLAMFIGVLVDRFSKKRWSQWMVFGQMVLLFSLYGLTETGHAQVIHYYIAGFLLMAFNYGFNNARVSMIKQVVPTPLLTSANARFSFMSTFIEIMGPAITGFILLLSSLHSGLLITGIAYLLAWIAISLLERTDVSVQATGGFWQEFKAGWKELLGNRPLWLITLLVIFLNATSGMYDAMIIFFAKDHLKLENSELGLVLSVAGVGGLLGSSVVAKLRRRFPIGKIMGMTILLLGLSYFLMVFASSAWVLCLSLFLTGLISTIESICIWTFRQETTPAHMIGRISGITGSIFKLGIVFSIYGSGWMTVWLGPWVVFLTAAVGNVVIFFVYRRLSLWRLG